MARPGHPLWKVRHVLARRQVKYRLQRTDLAATVSAVQGWDEEPSQVLRELVGPGRVRQEGAVEVQG